MHVYIYIYIYIYAQHKGNYTCIHVQPKLFKYTWIYYVGTVNISVVMINTLSLCVIQIARGNNYDVVDYDVSDKALAYVRSVLGGLLLFG
jgi:hypothetical protein